MRFWEASAFGQGVRRRCQVVNIVTLTLCFIGKFIDQGRHQRDHIGDYLLYLGARLNAAVEHAVEQILNRPAQLTNDQSTNHAPTALEGVERPADFGQCILVVGVGAPLREVLANGFEHFTHFLDKDFQQLFINWLFISRWRQQARRHIVSRRVYCLHWRGHHVSHRQGFFGYRFLRLFAQRSAWQLDFRQLESGQFSLVPVGRTVGLIQFKAAELHLLASERLFWLSFNQRHGLGVGQVDAEIDQFKIGSGCLASPLSLAG